MALLDFNWKPTFKELRTFSALLCLALFIVGWVIVEKENIFDVAGWSPLKITVLGLWTVAAFISLLGLFFVPAIKPIYIAWMGMVYPIGFLISYIIIGFLYYILFTVTGILLKLFRYDPLARSFDSKAKGYWSPREETEDNKRYLSQF